MPRHTADEQPPVVFLEAGDRLTRSEFERRYAARPDIKKAELIEGVVYVPSPTRHIHHGLPHAQVLTWLGVYAARTPGVQVSDNATLRMDRDNEPQPDALLRLDDALGGRSRVDADGFLCGAPELIVEVASSSASYDAGPKKNAYRRNGVQEYVIWRVLDRAIDWFTLREDAYEAVPTSQDGIFRSLLFPGLWLDGEALRSDRMDRVLDVLNEGLVSQAHRDFGARLLPRR